MSELLKMKFKAHQTFSIRKGWLSKGLKGVCDVHHSLLMPSYSREAMDELGLGSNQVTALRYWLETAGLITRVQRNREHELTELGQILLERDPYIEEAGSLWAIHCNIASAQEAAATWYFFFNVFRMGAFSREDFIHSLERYIFTNNAKPTVALTSLESDFSCMVNTYIPHERTSNKQSSPESVIDCPLGELGLMDVESLNDKTYRKRPANPSMLPSLLVLYAICSQRSIIGNWEPEMRLDSLLDGPCMPGRLFNLDSVSLLEKLYELESDGHLRINRTAGLDVIRLIKPDMTKEECLSMYYELIG